MNDRCQHDMFPAWCEACRNPVQRGEAHHENHIDTEGLKGKIGIEAVLIACGAMIQEGWGFKGEKEVFCPFHINTNTPAGSVNVMKGVYHCFACGAGGDIIALAKLHLQTDDFTAACKWLEETFL